MASLSTTARYTDGGERPMGEKLADGFGVKLDNGSNKVKEVKLDNGHTCNIQLPG